VYPGITDTISPPFGAINTAQTTRRQVVTFLSANGRSIEHPTLANLVAESDKLELNGIKSIGLSFLSVARELTREFSSNFQNLLKSEARLLGKQSYVQV